MNHNCETLLFLLTLKEILTIKDSENNIKKKPNKTSFIYQVYKLLSQIDFYSVVLLSDSLRTVRYLTFNTLCLRLCRTESREQLRQLYVRGDWRGQAFLHGVCK